MKQMEMKKETSILQDKIMEILSKEKLSVYDLHFAVMKKKSKKKDGDLYRKVSKILGRLRIEGKVIFKEEESSRGSMNRRVYEVVN